jgi:c-di-AMP phosphodiesterase-like protein
MDPRFRRYFVLRIVRLVITLLLLSLIVAAILTSSSAIWAYVLFAVLVIGALVVGVLASRESRKIRSERLALMTPSQANASGTARVLQWLYIGIMAASLVVAALTFAIPSLRVILLVLAGLLFLASVATLLFGSLRLRRRVAAQSKD